MDYATLYDYRRPPGWWEGLYRLPWRVTCHVKILIVTDGAAYGPGSGYNLSRFLEALQHDLPSYVAIDVTKAQHATSSYNKGDAAADVHDFRFHTHDLTGYDAVLIFAVSSGTSLEPGEATALFAFMQAGGGVFATGDHEALGVGLCGGIPRVRSMRRWFSPGSGPNGEPPAPLRDVLPGVGETDSTTGGDDFDGVPQVIAPKKYSAPGPFVFVYREFPHPVLCGRSGVITTLPDHMHEGRVEVPADLAMPISVDGVAVVEYPARGGGKLAPEVIARSTINLNPGADTFGVIGAYDGHLVDEVAGGVGRVVVDATWHHFWNMNVEQFADAFDRVRQAALAGVPPTPADLAPAQAWRQIREYFQNIALWLARRGTQDCIRRRGIWLVTHHVDVVMALSSDARRDRVGYLLDLGAKARDALQQRAPQCERIRFTWDWFDLPVLVELPYPWRPPLPDPPPFERQVPMLDGELLELVVLGAIVEATAQATGRARNARAVAKVLDDDQLDSRVAEAAIGAVRQLTDRLRADLDRVDRSLEAGPR